MAILTNVRWYLIGVLVWISLIINDAEHFFHVPVGHLYIFFGGMFVQISCPFFNWVVVLLLSCRSCLYILEIKPLSVASFETIFSHSVSCLFVFFLVSFPVKSLSVWLGPIGLFFILFLLLWDTDLRKHLYGWCQRMFCLCSLPGFWRCLIFIYTF